MVTNYSLHRIETKRLFQAGVDSKIIKEYTGYSSNAVNNRQVISEGWKENLTVVLVGRSANKSRKI